MVDKKSTQNFHKRWRNAKKSFDCAEGAQVLTAPLKIRKDLDYSKVPYVIRFQDRIRVTPTGIHRPKILVAIGSDGNLHKQLVKLDDLKGDAVMEQAFEVVNSMLNREPRTRQRQLHIRTYRVVPLSSQTGVIQWVSNTEPLGHWLYLRRDNAHARYKAKDEWTFADCNRKMKSVAGRSRQERLEAYLEVTDHFKPVFRHYFLERYPDPSEWFRRRVAYTRSVASNSIVGHILGIGDRHSLNVLIHNGSAEILHIDFGIVFEHGFDLPTPEQVRLL